MVLMKIYRCELCGNVVLKMYDGGDPLSCCGQPMKELVANSKDAALEKHVPAVTRDGSTLSVQVGDVLHPMTPEHYIAWILVEQGDKTQFVSLTPDDEPKAIFTVDPKQPAVVYEYCNLHGLWKKEV